jgi:hypothetical protein
LSTKKDWFHVLVTLQRGMLDMENVTHMQHLIKIGVMWISNLDTMLTRFAKNVENAVPQLPSTAYGENMVRGPLVLLHVVMVPGHVQELKLPLHKMAVLRVLVQTQKQKYATMEHAQD